MILSLCFFLIIYRTYLNHLYASINLLPLINILSLCGNQSSREKLVEQFQNMLNFENADKDGMADLYTLIHFSHRSTSKLFNHFSPIRIYLRTSEPPSYTPPPGCCVSDRIFSLSSACCA